MLSARSTGSSYAAVSGGARSVSWHVVTRRPTWIGRLPCNLSGHRPALPPSRAASRPGCARAIAGPARRSGSSSSRACPTAWVVLRAVVCRLSRPARRVGSRADSAAVARGRPRLESTTRRRRTGPSLPSIVFSVPRSTRAGRRPLLVAVGWCRKCWSGSAGPPIAAATAAWRVLVPRVLIPRVLVRRVWCGEGCGGLTEVGSRRGGVGDRLLDGRL